MDNPCQPRTSVYGGGFLNTRELSVLAGLKTPTHSCISYEAAVTMTVTAIAWVSTVLCAPVTTIV
jgi:hypothetical protein